MKFLFLLAALFVFSTSQAKMRMAVTIDDLPRHADMPRTSNRLEIARKMLDGLKRHSVPEVYGFVNAQKSDDDKSLEDILRLWVEYGYPLGNHTYSHKSINNITSGSFKRDIDKNEKVLRYFGGAFDWKYFRYPFLHEGNTFEKRNAVRAHLFKKGYKIAQVTVDFEDWSWSDPFTRCVDRNDRNKIEWLKKTFLKNAVEQLHRAEQISQGLFHRSISHILLLHVGAFNAEMMDELLTAYEKEGVEFIPLSEAAKDEVYAIDPAVIYDHGGSEFTFQIMKARGLTQKDLGLERYDGYPGEELKSVCSKMKD